MRSQPMIANVVCSNHPNLLLLLAARAYSLLAIVPFSPMKRRMRLRFGNIADAYRVDPANLDGHGKAMGQEEADRRNSAEKSSRRRLNTSLAI